MPSLVDSSIFMQAILCLPSLRKGSDKKVQNKIQSLAFYQMSPLVDLYFLQSIWCPSLRKGFHNQRRSKQEVITYQELLSSANSSTFTQIYRCRFTGKTINEKKQKEVITYILQRTGIVSSFLSFI